MAGAATVKPTRGDTAVLVSGVELPERPPPRRADHCWLPRSLKSPRLARRQLCSFLDGLEERERYADAGQLVLNELVSNALAYGTPRDRLVLVRFEVDSSWLRIEVHDASAVAPVRRSAGSDEECGRGLELVNSLADKWGYGPREGVGKVVWALIGPSEGEV